MCGPVIGILGAAVSAMGSIAQANAQAAGLKSQAQWQERQAKVERMKGNYAIAQQRRQTRALLGAQQATFAASGIDTTGGSPEDVAVATIQEREMDVQARRIQRDEEVARYEYEAANNRAQAKAVKTAGALGAVSAIVGSLGGIGGGVSGTSVTNSAFVGQPGNVTTPPHLINQVNRQPPVLRFSSGALR